MASIHLYVPQQTLTYSAYIDVRPKQVQSWLDALPAANLAESARMVRTALVEINKVKMPAGQRQALMDQFTRVVAPLADGLRASYVSSPLPPSGEQLHSINLLQQIYASIANSYKILVSDAQRSGKTLDAGNQDFMQALCGAMDFLSLQLAQAYEVYFPEPKRVWGELHYLYLLAQRNKVLEVTLRSSPGQSAGGLTVADRYKRAVMMTLSNPYHLIQGECALLYGKLTAWARQIRLKPWRSGECPGGHFFIDMGTDAAPRYAPAGMNLTPIFPFVVEFGDVLDIIRRLVGELKRGEIEGEAKQPSFADRKLRSTYERAAAAWGGRQERLGVRTHGMSDTVMLMGLSHCYRLFAEVAPELDFSALAGQAQPVKAKKKDSGLRLMDIEEHIRQAASQIGSTDEHATDTAMFDAGASTTHETVEVGAAPGVEVMFGDAKGDDPVMEEDTSRWRQRNQSQGGVSLFCFMDCTSRSQVGEIVAFRPASSRWNEDWRVGAVRWIRVQPGQGMEMGIRTLADDALAVRTKALVGVGAGGALGRGLLTPWGDPRIRPVTLLCPPAIYDEATVLALELAKDVVIPVRLDTLVDSSNRYSQYRFTCLEKPPKVTDWDRMK